MLGDAYKEEDIIKIQNLKADGIGNRKKRNILFNADQITWEGDLAKKVNENYKGGFPDTGTAENFVNGFWQQKKENKIAAG